MRFKERIEDARTFSHKECLAVVQRIYDLTGQPDLKEIIDRANASLQDRPLKAAARELLSLPQATAQ